MSVYLYGYQSTVTKTDLRIFPIFLVILFYLFLFWLFSSYIRSHASKYDILHKAPKFQKTLHFTIYRNTVSHGPIKLQTNSKNRLNFFPLNCLKFPCGAFITHQSNIIFRFPISKGKFIAYIILPKELTLNTSDSKEYMTTLYH